MIRGILDKSARNRKEAAAAAAAAAASASSTSAEHSNGSTRHTAIANSSSGSTASESSGRPTSGSEDTSGRGFFRDSTVPGRLGKKLFRATATSDPFEASSVAPQPPPSSSLDPFEAPDPIGHHPLHSSQRHTETPHSSHSHTSSHSGHSFQSQPHMAPPPMATAGAEPRAGKKCSLCGKNFNPLRRRYFCRVCTCEVCSNCSLKRKVDSSLEGAISIRICMACKMNTAAPQADYYDRAFSVASALHPGDDDGVFGGDVFGDRSSAASFMSASLAPASSTKAASQHNQPHFSSSASTTSSVTGGTTPGNASSHHVHFSSSASASGAKPKTPGPVSTGLRRTSSSASAHSAARSRRDSFGSAPAECHMCNNEACGPMLDFTEVQYPATEVNKANADRFVRARSLDNERERLSSVRRIRRALSDSPQLAQRFSQLCNMASIAAQSRVAVIALVDREDYFVVSETGLPADATPVSRTLSLAAHTCRNGAPLVCSDLSADIRFAGNPWRRDTLKVLFYAGIPLTLANGHTIGVIEVFDKNVRFACMDVVTQLQAVVRGLLKKFEEILAAEAEKSPQKSPQPQDDEAIATAIAALERSTSYTEVKPSPAPPRSPARRAPAPPAPATAPYAGTLAVETPAPVPVAVAAPVAAPEPIPVQVAAPVAAPTPTPAAPAATPAPAPAAAATQPTENEMEMRLMELLSQTTSTQEQLRNQQGQMVHAISSHSKQITELAKQLERMESTLASKLDGVAVPPPAKEQPSPESAP